MVANIRNMEIDNDTQNGITAMRVYGESLKGYMMQEAMASLLFSGRLCHNCFVIHKKNSPSKTK
ncbi:hypothetical protein H7R52_18630 [Weissella confusa]|uniref:Uncharacterized protein n=1 Tax=Weissella confusa TaxID=1583 RepID=A0A923SU94_WEICO|nr:hypothetical protein [Weissella confusa]